MPVPLSWAALAGNAGDLPLTGDGGGEPKRESSSSSNMLQLKKLFCGFIDGYWITPDDINRTRFQSYGSMRSILKQRKQTAEKSQARC